MTAAGMDTFPWYGVCRLSLVPLRSQPFDHSDQVSQLLFGDPYEVVERSGDGRWIKITTMLDLYTGWIDLKQHHAVSAEYYEFTRRAEFKITTDLVATILYNKITIPILMGSIIPISVSELFDMEEHFGFTGESKGMGQKRDAEFVLSTALKYLNAPYQWGGKSPFGIDCSGFTQMVFRIAGYSLPRDAGDQVKAGKRLNHLDEAMPADLAFFKDHGGRIHHVGILLDQGRIIHASGRVRVDNVNEEGILNADTKINTHALADVRRILMSPTS